MSTYVWKLELFVTSLIPVKISAPTSLQVTTVL